MANKPDKVKNETPLFYALSKHKSQSDRLSLVSMFLEHSASLNLNHLNVDNKTVFEAYASDEVQQITGTCSGTTYDQAA